MIKAAVERYGRLDIAVANAGIIPLASVVEATPERLGRGHVDRRPRHVLDVQVRDRADVDQPAAGPSSVCPRSQVWPARPRQSTYGPAKFVATGLTKHLAVEWASRGIRVNAVAPGTINTERVKRLPEEPGGPEYLETIKAAHPMKRLGEPSEVAEAILFLASDHASFITGAVLPVDGGFLAQ